MLGIAIVDCGVQLVLFGGEAFTVPVLKPPDAGSHLCDRYESSTSIRCGAVMRHEVCHRDAIPRDRKALSLLDAAHDRPAVVSEFPLTDRGLHTPSVAFKCYSL